MPARAHRFGSALLILVLLAAPLAVHGALVMHRASGLAGILVATQAALVAWIASSGISRRTLRAGACGGVFLFVLFLSRWTDGGPVIASGVPHAMAYAAVLALFAASLRPGREPVVTILARRSRGPLPAKIVRYTRRVTWAWCWFFVAQLVASLLLLLFASREVWSCFINVCNLPLIAAMFCTEYVYRQWRYAARSTERLTDILRVFRQIRAAPTGDDR
jgi:uncharacterized membrane protein